ncbi:putative metalloprotease 1 protein [Zalerion maritima]|uniref:Metalloprotease 1 protein n=1 Tax=Zalerion maritima TaxID=339359 RepID=A0AAD5RWG3_9PEZI|nr:putative metalloprotease 1 protein [Zalerion maritima]
MKIGKFLAVVLAFAKAGNARRFPLPPSNLSNPDRGWCATPEPDESYFIGIKDVQAIEARDARVAGKLVPRSSFFPTLRWTWTIYTFVHVVESKVNEGLVTDAAIRWQIKVLNDTYNPYQFKFYLVKVQHYVDDKLSMGPFSSDAEYFDDFLRKTRTGQYSELNIYIYSNYPEDEFGMCTMPNTEPLIWAMPEQIYDDGCHINAGSMPGGWIEGYNMGYTAVHEVGHWLGLMHTFQGHNCDGPGDMVADTPAQRLPTKGCPKDGVKDTCPGKEGYDAIHNFMDYSNDPCYRNFTYLQAVRMHNMYGMYRSKSVSVHKDVRKLFPDEEMEKNDGWKTSAVT